MSILISLSPASFSVVVSGDCASSWVAGGVAAVSAGAGPSAHVLGQY